MNDGAKGRSIHIVFTMNTLLNNRQFSNRLECFNNTYGKNAICVFTSLYKGPYMHINKIDKLTKKDAVIPRILIACSNKIRFSNCFDFVYKLAEENTEVKRVFIYFDELHKYISNIRKHIENMNGLDIVSGLYGMTASPYNVWSGNNIGFWNKINIINISAQYKDDDYIGVNDIQFAYDASNASNASDASESKDAQGTHGAHGTHQTQSTEESHRKQEAEEEKQEFRSAESFTIHFIIKTLQKHPNILHNESRVFIPVNARRKTHNYIKDHLFKIRPESIIITLNGVDKHIQYRGDVGNSEYTTIPIALNKGELGDLIADHIQEYGLTNRPIVFIGFNCVGMGQTLVSEKLGNFTSAIFGYNNISNDKMYQLFGRITGRFKNWKKYEKTTVYTTALCKNISYIMEKCAKNIAINHNNELLDSSKYLEPFNEFKPLNEVNEVDKLKLLMLKKNFGARDSEYFEWKEPLDNVADAEKILSTIFNDTIVVGEFLTIDDYYLSKNLKKYYKKHYSNLTTDERLTIDKYVKIKISLNKYISNECRKYKYILLPVYDSPETKEAKYYLHYSI